MKINYHDILNKNMINVFKDNIKKIEENGLSAEQHLYITFITKHPEVSLPKWLKDKYPKEITIVIQYEYYDLVVKEKYFNIGLSFNNIKTKLKISFNSIISFADPSANFGFKLKNQDIKINKNKKNKIKNIDNVINLEEYKKN